MRFLAPQWMPLAWLLVFPIVLYLFRRQARRVPVSTLLFFQTLAREHRETAWLRHVKRWLSLLLTLLVLLVLLLALLRPVGDAGEGAAAVVLVVDRSASMGAGREVEEQPLVRLKRRMLTALAQRPEVPVTLVAFDARAVVLRTRLSGGVELARALEEVQPLAVEGEAALAEDLAGRLAGLEEGTEIWWASDTEPDAAWTEAMREAGTPVRTWVEALARPMNLGLQAFQLRPLPLARGQWEGFARVVAAASNAAAMEAEVEIRVAGRLAQLRQVRLEPGGAATLQFPVEAQPGQPVTLHLTAAEDVLAADDGVAEWMPQQAPLRVGWVVGEDPDPFVETALKALTEQGQLEPWRVPAAEWPPQVQPDVWLWENWVPPAESWPSAPLILLNPPELTQPFPVRRLPKGLPEPVVRSVGVDHPVVGRVSTQRLAVTRTASLHLPASLEPLWIAGGEPLLAAGEWQGRRMVVAPFSVAASEQLALEPAFPVLLGNALFWCGEDPQLGRGVAVVPTGTAQWRSAGRWLGWTGRDFVEEVVGEAAWVRWERPGAWLPEKGAPAVVRLASGAESDLPMAAAGGEVETAAAGASWLPRLPGVWTWSRLLLLAGLGLLLLESWLCHRHAVY